MANRLVILDLASANGEGITDAHDKFPHEDLVAGPMNKALTEHFTRNEDGMEVTLRLETKDDYFKVEELTREAFWNLYTPGCDEHYLCHILRDHEDFIKELDYVAEVDGRLVASIMYTDSWLLGDDQERVKIVSFGPICVHPDYQRKGIGTTLIEKTKMLVKNRNIPAIVIYGDPHNYCRHGFRNGIDYQVSNMDGEYPLGLLVLELQPGFFGHKRWKAKQSDVFNFEREKALEFDKRFKEKERRIQDSQEIFKIQIRAFLKNEGVGHT